MEDSYELSMDTESLQQAESPEELYSCGKEDDRKEHDCCEKEHETPPACSNVFYQTDLVSVPVKVVPFAKAGHVTTVCCGSPVITSGDVCQGETDKVCEFTITQKLCIKLPLHFGASVRIDRAKVQCGSVSETECDCKNPCVRKCD